MMPIQNCPRGWKCSDECQYYIVGRSITQRCRAEFEKFWEDTPEETENRQRVREVAARAEEQMNVAVTGDIRKLLRMSSEEFWDWWGATSPPDPLTKQKEVLAPLAGPVEFGGGSKTKRKKSPKGNKPTEFIWGESS